MEGHMKRRLELSEYDELMTVPLGNPTKRQKNEAAANRKSGYDNKTEVNDYHHPLQVDSEHGCVEENKRSITKQKTTEERLELNRQRARDIRKRKKMMIKDMQEQLVLLTMEKEKLRTENQIQKEEIKLLRKSAQLLVSNKRAVTIPTAPPPTRLSNSDILNIINGMGNNVDDRLSEILMAPRLSANIGGNNAASLYSSMLPSPAADPLHQAYQHHTYPYGN
mmetsp:Transcript_771/g.858  ORF Transcript_771/g.858 Transcript_771/m.858 type:complete len:222 (-) Transcript_771:153-818(-)